jgi:hypothetical protein
MTKHSKKSWNKKAFLKVRERERERKKREREKEKE